MERQELIGHVQGVLQTGPPLCLAALFGSQSTGRLRPGSDVDIAIVPREPTTWSIWDEGRLASRLEGSLGRAVDLVRLDLAPTLLRWEIVKSGVPILADPPDAWTRLVTAVVAEHADFAPAAERVARSFLRHVASGSR